MVRNRQRVNQMLDKERQLTREELEAVNRSSGGTLLRPDIPAKYRKPRFKTFTPIGDQVAIHAIFEGKTAGGLDLPDGLSDPSHTPIGLVIAAGPACKYLKEGMEVVIPGEMAGLEIIHGGSGPLMLFKEELLMVGVVDEGFRSDDLAKKAAEKKQDEQPVKEKTLADSITDSLNPAGGS